MTPPLVIRLGTLAAPLAAFAEREGIDRSKAVRRLLAQALGVPEPPEYRGNPDIGQQSKRGAKARWKNR